jgi:hypothetical protein
MFRSLAVAAVLGALALPAAAASVTVDVGGLDPAAAHAKIVDAATSACRLEYRDATTFDQFYQHRACIAQAVSEAEAKLAASNRVARM